MQSKTSILVGALALGSAAATIVACQSPGGDAGSAPFMRFTGDSLVRPEGYREWVFVGEPVTPNDMNGGKAPFPEFHSVYIDPDSYREYARTGVFPDGTILVKELVSVGSKSAVSGKGYFMGDFIGLEATVKSKERFPDEPGHWAYFSFTDPGKAPKPTATAFPTSACNECHAASAADDFVFTQYYPVLRAAKGNGTPEATGSEPFRIDGRGVLQRPVGYREWVFVGEPLTPNDMNGGNAPFPEFHSVYIDPESYEHYERTGTFRDGTILVKELVSVGSKAAVSGKGYFMGEFIGLEATIKSAKHFPDEPGNWAYFSFTDPGNAPKPTATAFPTSACNQCHAASAADDFVFTQYYPVLRAAKDGSTRTAAADDGEWSPSAPTPTGSVGGVPLGADSLFGFLRNGDYRAFEHRESAAHPGRGPHTEVTSPVRVFYNDTLSNSLEKGLDEHPVGAVAVKEMLSEAGDLRGWAVMAKTQDSTDDGRGWFWYEVTSATNGDAIAAIGNGVPGCVSCHRFGSDDLVVSGFPLE